MKGKKFKIILFVGVAIGIMAALFLVFKPSSQNIPTLSSSVVAGTLKHDGIERSYLSYKPKDLPPSSPLVIVFHRAKSTGLQMRELTGYRFDKMADREKFMVVYPDGYEGNWNDCRQSAKDSAHKRNIDDVGFINALIDSFAEEHRIDQSRVFLTGLSNGGHMCFRLAMEIPEKIASIAVIAAHVPVKANNACRTPDVPVSILLASGTEDPINPFEGGEVSILGIIKKGQVLSAMGTVDYWMQHYGMTGSPTLTRFSDSEADDGSWVERETWGNQGENRISLYTVHGGGHTIPGAKPSLPIFWGETNQDIMMVDEIVSFFNMESNHQAPVISKEPLADLPGTNVLPK